MPSAPLPGERRHSPPSPLARPKRSGSVRRSGRRGRRSGIVSSGSSGSRRSRGRARRQSTRSCSSVRARQASGRPGSALGAPPHVQPHSPRALGGWLPRHRSASRDSYSEPPPCYVGRSSSRACHISLLCHISPFVQNRSLPAEFYEEVDCTVVNPSPPKRRSKKKITSTSPRARRLEPSEDLDTAALAKAAEGSAIAAENRDNGEGTAAC